MQLATLVARSAQPPELVLTGREFGDPDDGSFPPYLARILGRGYFGLAQDVRWRDGCELLRERGSAEETLRVATPTLAGVTNDRRNRLRHPLMKNVMAAKRATYPVIEAPAVDAASLALASAAPVPPPARARECRMLAGAPPEQARELAASLRPWLEPRQ